MPYDFAEALKVLEAGYAVARDVEGAQVAALSPHDIKATDWYTVNPPHITGSFGMTLR